MVADGIGTRHHGSKRARRAVVAAACGLALATSFGCSSTPKATAESETVELRSKAEVQGCEKLATSTVSVLSKIGFIGRRKHKIERDLVVMAKNEAAKRGGNAVVETSPAEDGNQTFELYRCPS